MSNETIEQKTYRLLSWFCGAQPPFKTIKQTNDFKLRCKMLELAIAEEREANAVECDNLHHAWRWDNEADSKSGPRQCAKAIRQRSAPKDEVNQ